MINKDELFFENGEPKSFFGFSPLYSIKFKPGEFLDTWVSPCEDYMISRTDGDYRLFARKAEVYPKFFNSPMKDYKSLEDIIEHYKELTDDK